MHKNDLLPRLAPLAFIRMMNFTSLIDIEDEAECEDDVFYDNIIDSNIDTVTSGLGDSIQTNQSTENSLIPPGGININHVSIIGSDPHFDPHFNEFCIQYNNFNNSNQNQNSTETGLIAFTNHLQSFTDHNFVNDISSSRANFNFQPSSSSIPSSYEPQTVTSQQTLHQMLSLTNENVTVSEDAQILAAPKAVKRGRPPLSEDVKAARAKDKLDAIQVAKRAKLAK